MARNASALLLRVFTWPFPPAAIGRVSLALVLTVAAVALAQVHSFAGVVLAAALAGLVSRGVHLLLRRQP